MQYNDKISQLMQSAEKMIAQETDAFEKAVILLTQTVKEGGLLHLVAGDMSSTGIFEPFMKPGCLCAFSPVTEPTLSTLHSASRAYYMRNSAKVGEFLVSYYRNIQPGDCIILADVCGSIASEEIIHFAKEHGQTLVYISGMIKETETDVQIFLSAADENLRYMTTSIALSLLINALNLAAIESLRAEGKIPDIWESFRQSGNEYNEMMIDKYRYRIKQL